MGSMNSLSRTKPKTGGGLSQSSPSRAAIYTVGWNCFDFHKELQQDVAVMAGSEFGVSLLQEFTLIDRSQSQLYVRLLPKQWRVLEWDAEAKISLEGG